MNIEKLELNKPSELTQVVFTQQVKKELNIYKMSALQIDLVNVMFYKVREEIGKHKLEIDESQSSTFFEFALNDFNNMLKKYNNNQYSEIIEQLDLLSDIKIIINSIGKNKDIDEMIITRFIQEIRVSKHKKTEKKKIKLAISNTIIKRFIDVKKYFSKMFLTIQFSMKSKYSKLLYELLKDYEGINVKQFDLNILMDLINVSEYSQRVWSIFNQNILKKAVKEINNKSDIKVSYEPIKERPDGGRLQVTKIKFMMEKQKCDLIDNHEPELSIEEQIKYNKKKVITEQRLKQAKQFQEIKNEDAWIKKTIESITDEFLEHQDKIIDAKEQIDNINIKDYTDKLSIKYGDIIGLDKYKLIYIFDESKPSITNNAKETLDILNTL